MKLIHNWLSSTRNFHVGKALYQSFGTDRNLLKLLDKGKTAATQGLLLKALQDIVAVPAPAPTPEVITPAAAVIMPDSDEPILKALKAEWMIPYQQMNLLRHQLHEFGSANDENALSIRKEKAFQILGLEQVCMKVWAKRDYYLKHKKLPLFQEAKLLVPEDPLELGRLVETTKRRIRDWKTKSAKDPANANAAAKLQGYREQFFLIIGFEYKEVNNG